MEFEGRSRVQAQLTLTPLIDVVFLLLVFFMLTSTFLEPAAVDLTLPSSETATTAEKLPIEVMLARDGVVLLNGEQVSLSELQARLEVLLDGRENLTVALKADAAANIQQMLEIVDRIRAAGGRSLALAAEPQR